MKEIKISNETYKTLYSAKCVFQMDKKKMLTFSQVVDILLNHCSGEFSQVVDILEHL